MSFMGFDGARTALSAAVLTGAAASQTAFTESYSYAADDYPYTGELGYVDGDAHLDYVVTNYLSNTLSVYLGTGTGTLTALPDVVVAGAFSPRGLALGELNGDGLLDAVVTLPSAGKVRVLHGDGAGGFTQTGSWNVGGFPVWVELGDLNGDGWLDIAAGNQATDDVSIQLATGTGTFTQAVNYPTGGYSCEEIALGDIDGDGNLDVAVASMLDNAVVSLLGDGAGGLALGVATFASASRSMGLADLNGNGRLDLVTVGTTTTQNDVVQVYTAMPSGAFLSKASYTTEASPSGVAIADMNSDGVPDVVAACALDDTLALFVGIGSAELAPAIESPASSSPQRMAAGDLNGDGIPDLVVNESLLDTISVYLGDGVGSYLKYCTGKVNSLGCPPNLYAYGTPSVSNLTPFNIVVSNMRSAQAGMLIYKVGGAQANLPFQGGTLCIGPAGIRRTPLQSSGGYPPNGLNCTGLLGMNFNAFALGQAGGNPDPGLLVVGNTYRVQVWGRDTGDPFGTALSSAIEVTPWF